MQVLDGVEIAAAPHADAYLLYDAVFGRDGCQPQDDVRSFLGDKCALGVGENDLFQAVSVADV